ncbi:abortive infection system toxin AbiGii family protein [Paenibacillus elgii]|uniref:abortive infection system toxin AbiGii family protein n=1 Tax=Paenibacillus elgii TaxID=189691 RepID=UPI00203A7FD6|nr:abortive infection system toxin AbiGii family protein [Paenibacillus elgii]MCM3274045.1 abortive infection system toxin AbiGii family protein [Paenibacillus elgii]
MFSSFDKAFNNKNQESKIPKEILDFLSEKLPDNFHYSNIDEGVVALVPVSGPITISGRLELSDGFIPSNPQELMEYVYRTQQELQLLPDDDGFIIINNTKFKLNDIVKFPFDDRELSGEHLIIKPSAFQPPFKIRLQGLGVEKEFLIQRQPYGDLNKSLFRDVGGGPLEISYLIDERTFELKLDCKLRIEKAKTIKEVVDNLNLYYACFKGDLKIMGVKLPKIDNPIEEKGIVETISFWKKIYSVELKLGVSFIPTFPVTIDDAIWFEKLYRSFIDQKPYKEKIKLDKISFTVNEDFIPQSIIGNEELGINYLQETELEIMGVSIKLIDVVTLFGFRVKDVLFINNEKTKCDVILDPKDEGGIYMSTRHFVTENEAKNQLEKIDEFQCADLIKL